MMDNSRSTRGRAIATVFSLCAIRAIAGDGALRPVGRAALCVTNGVVSASPDGRLAIETASSRGFVRNSDGEIAEIHFKYLGSTADTKPLASGELRRQIGLKLHAQDTCNLLYVMWHIEPDSKIGVSIKSNPTQHTHAECHANGYTTIRPTSSIAMPRILAGEMHRLRAELHGSELVVIADGRRAWVGSLGMGLGGIDGPVGFRTDNARFEFEIRADVANAMMSHRKGDESANQCLQQPGD